MNQKWQTIEEHTRNSVRLLTFNRPERLNAWTPQMAIELDEAVHAANEDSEVGSIVVTGAGRGFCAGADMDETFKKRLDGADNSRGPSGYPIGIDWVSRCRESKPLVAAVNGAAIGVGLTQILPFDSIVASHSATFSMAFVKVGLVPELASTHFLSQRIGFGMASELCLSGRMVDAEEAASIRLVDHVVSDDLLMQTAEKLAERYARNPAPQLRMIKRLLTRNIAEADLATVQQREAEMLQVCWTTPEHAEAVEAFLQKRQPNFSRH